MDRSNQRRFLVLLLMLLTAGGFLAYSTGVVDPEIGQTRADSDVSSVADQPTKQRAKPAGNEIRKTGERASPSDPAGTQTDQFRSGFDVLKPSSKRSRFRLKYTFPDSVTETRVRVRFFREDRRIPINVEGRIGRNGDFQIEEVLTATDKQLAPGIYRAVISFQSPPVRVPPVLRRTVDYLDRDQHLLPGVLRGKNWTWEFVDRLGTSSDIRAFRDNIRNRLDEYGNRLLDAWMRWYKRAMYGYRHQGTDQLDSFPDQMLDRLREMKKTARRFREAVRSTRRYIAPPGQSLRSDLRNFARDAVSNARAKSLAVVKQVTGKIPNDWPETHLKRGFRFNVSMKQELDYVRQNSVKVLRRKLRQFTPVQPTFRSMSTYVLWRARRARRLVRTFQRLLNERIPQRSLTTELPNSAEEKRGVLLHMDRYLRTRLALETAGLRHTVQRWGSDSMVTTVEKYIDQLRRVLRVELTQLAETMGVSVPEFNRAEQEAPDMKTSLVLERANRMFTRLREELSK